MRVTLTFDLPEDADDCDWALHGGQWRNVVAEIDEHLRRQVKYAGADVPEATRHTYDQVRAELRALLDSRGLSLV